MGAHEEDLELLLEDVLSDYGFLPGLRPRDHRNILGDGVANSAPDLAGEFEEQRAERLFNDFMQRGALDEESAEMGPPAPGVSVSTTAQQKATPALKTCERPDPPKVAPAARRNIRRLEEARCDVEAFEPRNVYQAELRNLLFAAIDHVRREHCKPGEEADFGRWWNILETYRRILAEPEMATPSARSILPKVLDLEPDELTERRLEHALGRRKPKTSYRRKKKRRRRRKKKRSITRL